MNVTDLFEMLGDLFTNGTLGHFEEEIGGMHTFRRLYINANGTSDVLVDKLAALFKELNLLELLWIYADYVFPYDRQHEYALNVLRGNMQELFSKSKAFFEELIENTAKQLDGKENYRSKLDDRCHELGWTYYGYDDSFVDNTMKSLLRVLGPKCETEQAEHFDSTSELQSNCYYLAEAKYLCGGESNRCFHKFLIRYANYDAHKYNVFVSNIAAYLLYERIIYAFCTRIRDARDLESPRYEPEIAAQIRAIRESLLQARPILTEEDSPCPTKPTTTPELTTSTVLELTASTGQQTLNPTAGPSVQPNANSTTVPAVEQTTNAITSPLESGRWADEAQKAAEQAIGSEKFSYPKPESGADTYAAAGTRMINLLNRSNPTYKYKVLVFFPAFDESEYCVRNMTNGDFYHSMYNNVRYVVARYSQKELDDVYRTWNQNVTANAAKIQKAFSDVKVPNLCYRLKRINKQEQLKEFRVIAAVKCARKFVWYELGYRYFQAAWTNSFAIPITQDSDYNSNCGMLVLF